MSENDSVADPGANDGTGSGKKFPPNSLNYYRKRVARMTLEQLAAALHTFQQNIGRYERRDRELTEKTAKEIAKVLGVPYELIGFSDSPDAYIWAAKAVPVIGAMNAEHLIEPRETGLRIGVTDRPPGTVAVKLTEVEPSGWFLLYDADAFEPVTKAVLARQDAHQKFVSRTADGRTYWRQIVPSHRRNRYHLQAKLCDPIYDIELHSVSEVLDFERPGKDLPSALVEGNEDPQSDVDEA
jgi:transcriptional regulator with XRE-family HTH domain